MAPRSDVRALMRDPSGTVWVGSFSGGLMRHVPPLPGPRLVTLPSPYALSHGTGVTPQTIATDVLKPALAAVEADLVVLSEP